MSTSPTVNPLGYQGVRSPNPPAIWFRPRDPDMVTFKDFRNYEIGDLWQNTVSKQFFILSSVATAQGMWDNITGPSTGGIDQLSDDLGNLATPALGIVQIAGGTNIKTTAAGNVVTIDIDGLVSVANGGTGVGTLTGVVTGNGIAAFTASPVTQYAVLAGDTANAVASIAPSATIGHVLTSNGNAAFPTFQPSAGGSGFSSILSTSYFYTGAIQTYTPTSGMKYCKIEVCGGGGGGGTCAAGFGHAAGGGGGGEYRYGYYSSTTIAAAGVISVDVGQKGSVGVDALASTVSGSISGVIISANGGKSRSATEINFPGAGANGGTGGTGGDFIRDGGTGGTSFHYPELSSPSFVVHAPGGSSFFSTGAPQTMSPNAPGSSNSFGGGGGGAGYQGATGKDGSAGVIVITEYIT